MTFDQVYAAYREQAQALHEGGVDLFLVETIFDTLNAKAAIKAILDLEDEGFEPLPIWISGTITDRSGRTLSGQTVEAFWNSVRHARPFAVGLNCALGAELMRPHIAELARIADTLVAAYPERRPAQRLGRVRRDARTRRPRILEEWAKSGLVNILGGCCGTTPDHIRHIAEAVEGRAAARRSPSARRPCASPAWSRSSWRDAGVRALAVCSDLRPLFVNIGERTNVTGSARFRKLISDGDYPAALAVARQQVEAGAQVLDVNMDEGLLDSGQGHDDLPQPDRRRARHRPRADHDRLLEVGGDRGRPEVRAGQGDRQLDLA